MSSPPGAGSWSGGVCLSLLAVVIQNVVVSSGSCKTGTPREVIVLWAPGPRPAPSALSFGSQDSGDTKITKWQRCSRMWQRDIMLRFVTFFLAVALWPYVAVMQNGLSFLSLKMKWVWKENVCRTYQKIWLLRLYSEQKSFIGWNLISYYRNTFKKFMFKYTKLCLKGLWSLSRIKNM